MGTILNSLLGIRHGNRIFLTKGHRFYFARFGLSLSTSCRISFCQLSIFGPNRLYKLEHETNFAINCCIRGEKLFDLERGVQVEELIQNIKDVLHKGVVVLCDQVAEITLLNVVCHILRVDEEDVVNSRQVNTRVAGQNPAHRRELELASRFGAYFSVDT